MALFSTDDTAPTPFTWGANGARMTPDQIAAQRKVADALSLQAGDGGAFPVGTRGAGLVTQGLNRLAKGVSAGLDYREADQAATRNADDNRQMIAALLNGGAPAQAATPAAAAASGTAPPAAAPAQANGFQQIPTADGKDTVTLMPGHSTDPIPSPLDPPSGQDRDHMIRTIYGEAGNEPTQGQLAVASVIRNRAVDGSYGGNTPSAVVHAPGQFEPWSDPAAKARMMALDPNSPQYAAISKVVDAAYGTDGREPQDPTEGKTLFYSPSAQAALGRPAPAWAKGDGQVIGRHTFYDDQDTPVAAFAPTAAAPSPGVAAVTAAANGAAPAAPATASPLGKVNPAVISALTSPYADEGTKKVASLVLAQQMAPKSHFTQETDAKGNIWNVDTTTGQKTVALKDDEANPKWAIVNKDQYGQPVYGYTPTPEEYKAQQAAKAAAPPADQGDLTNVHGKDYMDALNKQNPGYASTVRAIIEGRAPYPTGMLLKTPYGQKLAQDVTQADPSFEAGNATARVKVRNEFTAGGVGSPAGQITAGNTAIQHAGEMSDALERMKADEGVLSSVGNSNIPYISKWANEAHNASVQGTAAGAPLNDFMTAKNHFAEEVTKFYAGTAGSEAERTRALANLDAAKSLPELRSAIKTEANLMQGKVNALQDRWRTGMGPLVPDFPLVQPKSQAAIDAIMKRDAASTAQPAPAAAAVDPAAIAEAKRRGLIP